MKTGANSLFTKKKSFSFIKGIVKIGVFVFSFLVSTSCMMIPYYKTMPYLPAVKGNVIDTDRNGLENVKIYWKGETPTENYQTFTVYDGSFQFKVIEKYITWQLLAMDPGWGGVLVFEKQGYKTVTEIIVGLYDPKKEFEIEVVMELNVE